MDWDWGTIAAIVALVSAIFVVARWTGKVDTRLLSLESSIQAFDTRLLSVEGSIKSLGSKIDDLTTMIINPTHHGRPSHSSQEGSGENSPVVKKSPLTFSEKGVEMVKRLEAEDTVKLLVDKIDVPQDASPFAIQQASEIFAFTRMMEIVSSDVRLKIENEAYEDGGNIGSVLTVYGVLLRNKILESRGLPVPEYDTETVK